MSRPFFARDRISDFDIFERYVVRSGQTHAKPPHASIRHTEDAIKRAKARVTEGVPIDFQVRRAWGSPDYRTSIDV